MCELVQEEAGRNGWKTAFGTTQDLPALIDIYRRSKVVLNHATDVGQPFGMGYGLQCRHFEVAMTRTALLSNVMYEAPTGFPFLSFDSERSLIDVLGMALEKHEWFGRLLYDYTVDGHLPQHRASQLIDFIGRNACA
jgi:hypothetical protein